MQYANLLSSTLKKNANRVVLCQLINSKTNTFLELTGAELDLRARAFAANLLAVAPNERTVVTLMDEGIEFGVILVGCIYAGITVVPTPIPKRAGKSLDRITSILSDCKSGMLLTNSKYESLLNSNEKLGKYSIHTYEGVQYTKNEPLVSFRSHEANVAVIQYSSGSTSSPKGAKITCANILANRNDLSEPWNMTEGRSILLWLPNYHDMGLFAILHSLSLGMRVDIMSPFDFVKKPSKWIELISERKINVSGGPAFAYSMVAASTELSTLKNLDLSHWDVAFCGADYVPIHILEDFELKLNNASFPRGRLFSCYGMAEATVLAAGQPIPSGREAERKSKYKDLAACYLGPSFKPKVAIFDDKGSAVLNGCEGEICLRGDNITHGYVSSERAEVKHDGVTWFRTADLGIIDGDWLTVTGRKKDLVKIRGIGIYSIDLGIHAEKMNAALNANACLFENNCNEEQIFSIETYGKTANTDITQAEALLKAELNECFGLCLSSVNILPRGSLVRTTSGKIQRWR